MLLIYKPMPIAITIKSNNILFHNLLKKRTMTSTIATKARSIGSLLNKRPAVDTLAEQIISKKSQTSMLAFGKTRIIHQPYQQHRFLFACKDPKDIVANIDVGDVVVIDKIYGLRDEFDDANFPTLVDHKDSDFIGIRIPGYPLIREGNTTFMYLCCSGMCQIKAEYLDNPQIGDVVDVLGKKAMVVVADNLMPSILFLKELNE